MTRCDINAPLDLKPGQEIFYQSPNSRKVFKGEVIDGKVHYGHNREARYRIRVPGKGLREIPAGWIRRLQGTSSKDHKG